MDDRRFYPGPTLNTVRADDGTFHAPPEGWALLPPGDAGLTRRVKAAGDHWVVQEKVGRMIFSRGIWAAAATIDRVRAELEAEGSTEGYARRQEKPLHLGGPAPGPLVVLHEIEALSDREIVPGVYCTLDAVKAQEVASRKAEPSLILANHAAWEPGQLEAEFGSGHWHTLPATAEVVFWRVGTDLWDVMLKRANGRRLSEILNLRGMLSDPRWN